MVQLEYFLQRSNFPYLKKKKSLKKVDTENRCRLVHDFFQDCKKAPETCQKPELPCIFLGK